MSGHSKWANIKHKKGKTDALKAKLATKIGREITVAARMGGADPTGNMRLKLALQKARENNIPKDNIQRAIDKGVGATDMNAYEEIVYEGYGPAGVAVTVEVITDNRNLISKLRKSLTRCLYRCLILIDTDESASITQSAAYLIRMSAPT